MNVVIKLVRLHNKVETAEISCLCVWCLGLAASVLHNKVLAVRSEQVQPFSLESGSIKEQKR